MFNSIPSTSCIVTIEIKRWPLRFVPVNMMECRECAAPVGKKFPTKSGRPPTRSMDISCFGLQHLARQLELSYFDRSITLNTQQFKPPKITRSGHTFHQQKSLDEMAKMKGVALISIRPTQHPIVQLGSLVRLIIVASGFHGEASHLLSECQHKPLVDHFEQVKSTTLIGCHLLLFF
jgi:hypothetical protein